MLDILARMRDVADTHNIAPVISQLLKEGYSCAIVCDTKGKAFQTITSDFPHLLSNTTQLGTNLELYRAYPSAKVYFGSMLSDNIGRDPFSYYKQTGSTTATIQETPGWRLSGWNIYPDTIFTMPGGKETIQKRWPNFHGNILETGMPQYEHISEISLLEKLVLLEKLKISEDTKVISINFPAHYTQETLTLIEEVVQREINTTFLCNIHPKASTEEKELCKKFYTTYSNALDCVDMTLTERFSISDFTIGSIVSTTLITASLCNSIPVALINTGAKQELYELGKYTLPTQFPYVKDHIMAVAKDATQLLSHIHSPGHVTGSIAQPSSKYIIKEILKTLHTTSDD